MGPSPARTAALQQPQQQQQQQQQQVVVVLPPMAISPSCSSSSCCRGLLRQYSAKVMMAMTRRVPVRSALMQQQWLPWSAAGTRCVWAAVRSCASCITSSQACVPTAGKSYVASPGRLMSSYPERSFHMLLRMHHSTLVCANGAATSFTTRPGFVRHTIHCVIEANKVCGWQQGQVLGTLGPGPLLALVLLSLKTEQSLGQWCKRGCFYAVMWCGAGWVGLCVIVFLI